MTTDAKLRISAEDRASGTIRQIGRELKQLDRQAQYVAKFLRGGAILGAAYAFERLAENAEAAAKAIGDEGTADALRRLNEQIDRLKSKGLNVIGQVLGSVYIAVAGRESEKLTQKLAGLRREYEGLLQSVGGDVGLARRGPRFVQIEQEIAALSAQQRAAAAAETSLDPLSVEARKVAPPRVRAAKAGAAAEPVLPFAELQSRAIAELDRETNEDVARWVANVSSEVSEQFNSGGFAAAFETATEVVKEEVSEWSTFADQAARNMQDAFAQFLFDPFEDGLDGMLRSFLKTLQQMAAQMAAQQLFKFAAGSLSGSGNPFLSAIGGFFGGARAAGGPVMAGRGYLVGERGPEMFVPRSSGAIIPNGAGGAVSLVYNIDARGATTDLVAALPAILERTKNEAAELAAARMRNNLTRRGRI